jgi:hypothetical protein
MVDDRATVQSPNDTAGEMIYRPVGDGKSHRLQRGLLLPCLVFLIAGFAYLSVFRRAESIPTAVGANLVPAERVLKGEVPYLHFYKIQAPGILLVNAAVFGLFGTGLLTALATVLVFKVLTIVVVFLCARSVAGWKAALIAALLSLVWLAPGGPFRSAPVQFEMFFIVSAIWFTLRWVSEGQTRNIFLAGLAVGVVAVFKQNVGVYSFIALAVVVLLNRRDVPRSFGEISSLLRESLSRDLRLKIIGLLGVSLPLAAMASYLIYNGAFGAAIGVFLRGPREHLQARFTGYPLPKPAAALILASVVLFFVGRRLIGKYPRSVAFVNTGLVAAGVLIASVVTEDAINNSIYWFAPCLFAAAIWIYYRGKGDFAPGHVDRSNLLVLLLFSMAAYGEVFPRSVRGLVIDTIPPSFVLLTFLLRNKFSNEGNKDEPSDLWKSQRKVIFAYLTVVMLIFAARTIGPAYFVIGGNRILNFRADTELKFDRGRGVFLPAKRARRVSLAVELVRSRVEPGGYIFAHAVDATSYYFLADRNSPTGATLWNDTGTNDAERARTVAALREKQVRLVLTNERALEIERYGPLLDLLNTEFHVLDRIGQMSFLERNY